MKSKVEKIFTILLVLYPILSIYMINWRIIVLSLADTILLIMLPLFIICFISAKYVIFEKDILLLFMYCFLHFGLISAIILNNTKEVFIDECHFLLVLFILSVLSPNLFDANMGLSAVRIVSIVSSCFLIVQFLLLKTCNIFIPGQVPFFEASVSVNGHIRPFSFFSEPSAFGLYNSVGLATILCIKSYRTRFKVLFAGIITFALIISTSTTSLGLMSIVYIYWFTENFKKKFKYLILISMILVPLLVLVELKYGIFHNIYEHSFEGILEGKYASGLMQRIEGYSYAFKYHSQKCTLVRLFGSGMGNLGTEKFIPSIGRINIYYGRIGYIIFALFYLKKYVQADRYGRTLYALAIISTFFSEAIFGIAMIWYIPYTLYFSKQWAGLRKK